jgi:hypothetical protein
LQYRPSVWKFILLAEKTNEIFMSLLFSGERARHIWCDLKFFLSV